MRPPRKRQVIVMPNMVNDAGVVRIFKLLEENVPNAKQMNSEMFESIIALVFYEASLLKYKVLLDRRVEQIATKHAPYPQHHLTEDDVEELIEDSIELMTESCMQLDSKLSRKITRVLRELDFTERQYDRIDIHYGTPSTGSLTIVLSDEKWTH